MWDWPIKFSSSQQGGTIPCWKKGIHAGLGVEVRAAGQKAGAEKSARSTQGGGVWLGRGVTPWWKVSSQPMAEGWQICQQHWGIEMITVSQRSQAWQPSLLLLRLPKQSQEFPLSDSHSLTFSRDPYPPWFPSLATTLSLLLDPSPCLWVFTAHSLVVWQHPVVMGESKRWQRKHVLRATILRVKTRRSPRLLTHRWKIWSKIWYGQSSDFLIHLKRGYFDKCPLHSQHPDERENSVSSVPGKRLSVTPSLWVLTFPPCSKRARRRCRLERYCAPPVSWHGGISQLTLLDTTLPFISVSSLPLIPTIKRQMWLFLFP